MQVMMIRGTIFAEAGGQGEQKFQSLRAFVDGAWPINEITLRADLHKLVIETKDEQEAVYNVPMHKIKFVTVPIGSQQQKKKKKKQQKSEDGEEERKEDILSPASHSLEQQQQQQHLQQQQQQQQVFSSLPAAAYSAFMHSPPRFDAFSAQGFNASPMAQPSYSVMEPPSSSHHRHHHQNTHAFSQSLQALTEESHDLQQNINLSRAQSPFLLTGSSHQQSSEFFAADNELQGQQEHKEMEYQMQVEEQAAVAAAVQVQQAAAEFKAKQEAEQKAKEEEEAENKAKEKAEFKAKEEETEFKAKQEAEQKAKEEEA